MNPNYALALIAVQLLTCLSCIPAGVSAFLSVGTNTSNTSNSNTSNISPISCLTFIEKLRTSKFKFKCSNTSRSTRTCTAAAAASHRGGDSCAASTTNTSTNNINSTSNINSTNNVNSEDRRSFLRSAMVVGVVPVLITSPSSANAETTDSSINRNNINNKAKKVKKRSRSNGYAVQHTEREWSDLLSPQQYSILRNGGTERQRNSILNDEYRQGTYVCAGCQTALFGSDAKFKSGTGWPSFASALDLDVELNLDLDVSGRGAATRTSSSGGSTVAAVEVEDLNAAQIALGGAEVRCQTCGGHLGDIFSDGWKFVGTPAARTGKRYCIDGAALVFRPAGSGEKEVRGDRLPPNKVIQYDQPMYRTTSSS